MLLPLLRSSCSCAVLLLLMLRIFFCNVHCSVHFLCLACLGQTDRQAGRQTDNFQKMLDFHGFQKFVGGSRGEGRRVVLDIGKKRYWYWFVCIEIWWTYGNITVGPPSAGRWHWTPICVGPLEGLGGQCYFFLGRPSAKCLKQNSGIVIFFRALSPKETKKIANPKKK